MKYAYKYIKLTPLDLSIILYGLDNLITTDEAHHELRDRLCEIYDEMKG